LMPVYEKHKTIMGWAEQDRSRLDAWLRRGVTAERLAEVAVKEWKLDVGDLKPESVARAIRRYAEDRLEIGVIEKLRGDGLVEKMANLAKQVEPLDELTKLYLVQRARIAKLLDQEDQMHGLTLKTLSDEIKLGAILLEQLKSLQMDVGLIRRAPKTVEVKEEDGVLTYRITEGDMKEIDAFMGDAGEYAVADPA
jgi:hypothetical protein